MDIYDYLKNNNLLKKEKDILDTIKKKKIKN